MKIRELQVKDANLMLEWMHDPKVNIYFKQNFNEYTIDKIINFIEMSNNDKLNKHFAIVNDEDEYMGTISLKNITDTDAEYAITLRSVTQGKGYGYDASKYIIDYAFNVLNLKKVYLNVIKSNIKANNLYNKLGFKIYKEEKNAFIKDNIAYDLNWYSITKETRGNDMFSNLKEMGDEKGKLIAIESNRNVPFEIQRLFYIYDCQQDVERGIHANLNSKFAFVCVQGSCSIETDNGKTKDIYKLDKKTDILAIDNKVWKKMYDFSDDCILLVFSDCLYDKSEYIYDYDEFLRIVNSNE